MLCGTMAFLLGAIVLFGWYTHNPDLIQVNRAFVPMQYNTALGFLIAAIGLLFLSHSNYKIAGFFGLMVFFIGFLTIIEYISGWDLHIDQLFMEHYIDLKSSLPGRMAPNTALCFTLSGLIIILSGFKHKRVLSIIGTLGVMTIGLGTVAFTGYLTGMETAYGWGNLTRMAIHTAFGFIILGVGFFIFAWDKEKDLIKKAPKWLPLSIGIISLTITIAFWQAIIAQSSQNNFNSILGDITLISGSIISLLLIVITYKILHDKSTQRQFMSQIIVPVMTIISGVFLALSLYSILHNNFQKSVYNQFKLDVQNYTKSIEYGISQYIDILYLIQAGFNASNFVEQDEFRILVDPFIKRYPGIQAFEWVPKVSNEMREVYEEAMTVEIGENFYFFEESEDKRIIPVKERDWYYPVYYIEPLEENKIWFGLDAGNVPPAHISKMKSVVINAPSATQPFALVQTSENVRGVIISLPVFEKGFDIETISQRVGAVKGFVSIVLKVGPMLDSILESTAYDIGLDFDFIDLSATEDNENLYNYSSNPGNSENSNSLLSYHVNNVITIADRQWEISSSTQFNEIYPNWNSDNLRLPLAVIIIFCFIAVGFRRSAVREVKQKLIEQEIIKARDAAEAADKAKSDFLANMSHEIRTPMNAIIGLGSLLAKTDMSSKQRDYADKIGSSAKNLLGIINDILDFSKIEAGKLEIENTTFVLNDVLLNLSSMIGSKAREKDLELIFNQDLEVPQYLVGDPLRLGQILLNLTNNAIKFTDKGEIVVQTKILENEKENLLIRFDIKDTGIGLTDEQVGKLFQSFSQADTSTTRKYGGTGLGLSISKRLSEMMGGEIGVMSEYGKGSTFFFTVRLGLGEGRRGTSRPNLEELKGLKVLVVDDNETAREVLTSYLEDSSFSVKSVASGELAIRELIQSKAARQKDYDLVLMDYQMPGLNGIEISRKIRNELENVEVPKIIMVTGFGREEIMKQADEVGLQGFLIKPVSPSMLNDTIMEAFGLSSGLRDRSKNTDDFKPDGFESIRGSKLLLVEDNVINQQVARETLEQEGFFVDIADDGKIAIGKMYENNNYDLILMDLQMPVMDGYEATEEIRKDTQFDNVPIVAMTADAMTGVQEQVKKIGMNGYVTKPINQKELWKSLVLWIEPGERELPEGFSLEKTETDSINFPAIEGIDIEAGLKRVGNNSKLYSNLIKRFVDDYSDVTRIINEFSKKGQTEEAVREAHTVKGVSANLGAGELQEQMADIEEKLKDGAELKDSLAFADEIIEKLVLAIEKSGVTTEEISVESEKVSIPTEDLIAKLQSANDSLSNRKPKPAIELYQELDTYDLPLPIRDQLKEISNLIAKYKMKDAAEKIDKIIKEIQTDDE